MAPAIRGHADFAATGKLPGLGSSARIWSVAFDPGNGNIALAGTDNGIYRSVDQGQTWTAASLTGTRVYQVGFDARPPFAAYAALATRGIQRSDDGGTTWVDSSSGLGNLDVQVLAFGVDGIGAGTADGLDVSTDGRQWRPAGLAGYSISALAVAANSPAFTLVAGVDRGDTSAGFLFRTTSGGITPEVLNDGLPDSAVVTSAAAGPLPQGAERRPLLITSDLGVYHSIDGGTTWAASTGIPTQPTTVRLTCAQYSALDPNLVYAGSDSGGSSGGELMRSIDGGATFSLFDGGLPEAHNVTSIAVLPIPQPIILAAINPPEGPAGIFRDVDTTAPAPAPTTTEGTGAPIPAGVPTAAPAHTVPVTTRPAPAPAVRQSFLQGVFNWPLPLSLELLVLLAIGYAVVRWRQRYLDVEGPP